MAIVSISLPFLGKMLALYMTNATRSQNTLTYSVKKKKGLHTIRCLFMKFEPPIQGIHSNKPNDVRNVYTYFRRPNKNNNTNSRHDDIIRSIQHKCMYLYIYIYEHGIPEKRKGFASISYKLFVPIRSKD